ncbi:MAG: NAD(P)H-quinone oxidoreductase subunit 3 [Syntrophomonadaceae bacterium]|nr:NAD(P)H-quinone oxidoreductase subunit 3 [Syntrophomonadaceae bacterium]
MLNDFAGIGVFFLVALSFGILALATAWLVNPKRPNPIKQDTYECGLKTEGETWVQFRSQYFLYGLVFVAFDVECVFLYPWAVQFQCLGLFAFIEMFIFICILLLGLWYAWKEGALEWI